MTTRTLGWLHLTDLHVGQPRDGGRLGSIETALLDDLAAESGREKMPFDVVFFTGDVAFRGSDREFIGASALLGRIMTRIAELNQRYDAGPPLLMRRAPRWWPDRAPRSLHLASALPALRVVGKAGRPRSWCRPARASTGRDHRAVTRWRRARPRKSPLVNHYS